MATLLAAGPARPDGLLQMVMVVSGDETDTAGPTSAQAEALAAAQAQVDTHPDKLGGAWWDPRRRRLVVGYVRSRPGAQREAAEAATGAGRRLETAASEAVPVTHSWQALTTTAATALDTVALDGTTWVASEVDVAHNRVIVTATRITPLVRHALWLRYGDAVVLHQAAPATTMYGRHADTPPVYGGAYFAMKTSAAATNARGCTSGFEYAAGTRRYWLVAGHCAPQGTPRRFGYLSTRNALRVPASGYRRYVARFDGATTWREGTGSIRIGGRQAGDVALLTLRVSASPRIYVGGALSSSSAPVVARWARAPVTGDMACAGGAMSGEICGWRVTSTRAFYQTGLNRVGPVVKLTKRGRCARPGDSGGPVYTKDTAGRVYAKGIESGASGGGGDHWAGGWPDDPCVLYIATIQQARAAFGGNVVVR